MTIRKKNSADHYSLISIVSGIYIYLLFLFFAFPFLPFPFLLDILFCFCVFHPLVYIPSLPFFLPPFSFCRSQTFLRGPCCCVPLYIFPLTLQTHFAFLFLTFFLWRTWSVWSQGTSKWNTSVRVLFLFRIIIFCFRRATFAMNLLRDSFILVDFQRIGFKGKSVSISRGLEVGRE